MGLSLQINTQYGTPVNYWHISRLQQDFEAKGLEIVMSGFVSQDARTQGDQPMTSKVLNLSDANFIPDATRAALYDQIKTMPDFAGATDC